ncbi:MAG: Coenzyme F420 hydrogenase/dehydrogenase, beta subunit C-terminal domain [Clostridium sp.]|jgi:coenzyme F420-reducing hydrogenase beta subunit|nr:Coenzyme F420 hydrogenase/dehydrogenase, beta subunit C-terminal domain [Clostridium sp.]MCI1714261.1 Coenzyme F420 hydrogenase/dehydrogenase, beta subunit C-terminal domain [Clostridium sp.]MCI1798523.1 Coenzyme F420 hydrogenase/dehydrogenase, beta subunit C-terminal domain [Clostridium sp.]MCI1812746.1 Coenzyme F420 hydrogenase/dehydrogenase, beta subunit C-terminal domain [Clostridium sp.]MCI1869332.1 Coenzyme F420 hydrogenase/dehydrogenase, beta subunit C-terminal domain [Clostridium sp.
MIEDDEGFYYPNVDMDKCINCRLCEKVCPFNNDLPKKQFSSIAYACKNINENIRLESSSGGIFSVLCKYAVLNKGVVFGAAFNEDFKVIHTYTETLEDCNKFYGSKYVQSSIMDSYKQAKEFLDNNRVVLFSGTQCQIKGLNTFLQKKYLNLITVDVVCHGVPSPLVFKKYIDYLARVNNSKVKLVKFRDKKYGWHKYSHVTEFKNGKIYSRTVDKDIFMQGFLKDLYLRPSCYECKAKNYKSNSEFSLADYWGIEKICPDFDDDKGVSLVILNNEKSLQIFSEILSDMEVTRSNLDYATKYNQSIIKSVNYNKNRKKYFKVIHNMDVEKAIIKYTKVNFASRVKRKIVRVINSSNKNK